MKKAISIVAFLLAIVIIVLLVAFFYQYTEGFTEPLRTFYVECGNKKLFTESRENVFTKRLTLRAHNALDVLKINDFTYDILPYNNFKYTVNGKIFYFADVESFQQCFGERTTQDSLTIDFNELYMKDVLANLHNVDSSRVELGALPKGDLFKLTISSNGNSVCIYFRLGGVITDISLDPAEVEF